MLGALLGGAPLETTYGYPNSFFRKRGCVSLFDFRSPEQVEAWIYKCSPFHVPRSGNKFAYLFLSADQYDRLIPWTRLKEEQAWGDMIVPYIEAGYLGSIAVTSIAEIIRVTVEYQKDSEERLLRLDEGRRRNAERTRGEG